MNDNLQEDCAERVHDRPAELFSERAYYDSGASTVWKTFPPPFLTPQ